MRRAWRIYAVFAQRLIGIARCLYAEKAFGVDLDETVYALHATTINLCLTVFPSAPFRSTKAAVKMHEGGSFFETRAKSNLKAERPVFLTNNFTLPPLTSADLYPRMP